MQAQIAGCFEDYSDFGSTTKPKYALAYRPFNWLLLRASYGQSFLAPNLSYLYTAQVTQFSDSSLEDPKRPADAPRQIITRSGGYRNLKPETTTTYYAGLKIEPASGPLKGWAAGVDWFEFKQKNLIAQLGEDFILSNEDALPGRVVRNPPAAGETVGLITSPVPTTSRAFVAFPLSNGRRETGHPRFSLVTSARSTNTRKANRMEKSAHKLQ